MYLKRTQSISDVLVFDYIFTYLFIYCFYFSDDLPSAKRLLQKIVPLGSMPSIPDGFPSLSELKTDNFDYNINKGKVTVVADLENPVQLLGQGMTINDVKMTFKYDKKKPGRKWKFDAEGKMKDSCGLRLKQMD